MRYDLNKIEVHAIEIDKLHQRMKTLDNKKSGFIDKLKNNESLSLKILDTLPINVFLEDREGRTIFANKQACKCNGKSFEELVGKTVYDFFPLYIANQMRADDLEVWQHKKLITKETLVGFLGQESFMYTGKTIIRSDESDEEFLLGFGLDIHDRVKAEKQLRDSEEKFRNLVDQAADCFFLIEQNGLIMDVNSFTCDILGYQKEELLQLNIVYLFSHLYRKIILRKQSNSHSSINFEDMMKRKDGTTIPVDINLRLITISDRQVFLALCRDISEKKKTEAQIKHMAFHDALTGLPNRWYLQTYSEHNLPNGEFCLMLLDLDHFKVINDSLGHQAGDILLQDVAYRLSSLLKNDYTLARIGGDEFILIAPTSSKIEANALSEKIMQVMEKPFHIFNNKINVTTSIGTSMYPCDGTDINMLIRNADIAMYRSKEQGRNCVNHFHSSMKDYALSAWAWR